MATPSIDDLVRHCEIEKVTLRKEVCSDLFYEVSRFLSEWRLISPMLGITGGEVEAIENDNRTVEMQRIGFLKRWKQKFSILATYEKLIRALLNIGRADDAKGVCQLFYKDSVPKSTSPPPPLDMGSSTSPTPGVEPSTSAAQPATTKATPPPFLHSHITHYLKILSNAELKRVGAELGLHHHHLKKMNQEGFLGEMVDSWLRRDDRVKEASGPPSWDSLVKALEEEDFNGIAADIKEGLRGGGV